MPINSQRYFMRKEDYEPRRTPDESPFRAFRVSCNKCDCYKLAVTAHYDEQTGETSVVLTCGRCRQRESITLRL